MTTLVVHPGSLGDQLVASWALARLRARGDETLLASRGEIGELLAAAGCVDRWIDLDGPHGARLLEGATPPGFPLADRVVLFRDDPDDALRAALEATGIDAVVASARPPPGETEPARARVARLLGLEPGEPAAPWLVPPGGDPPARDGGVWIHPGSGGRDKRWPVGELRALADELDARGWPVRWVLGPADPVEELEPPAVARAVVEPGLEELARALTGAAAWVGCDSGASHLAVALGLPSVVLFGPSDPRIWAWEAPWVRNPVGDPAAGPRWGLTRDRVLAALLDVLSGASRYCAF